MSAKAQTDDGIPEEITNGINLDTDEPIMCCGDPRAAPAHQARR